MSQEANKRSDENEKKTFADLLTLFIVKFRFRFSVTSSIITASIGEISIKSNIDVGVQQELKL